MAKIVEKIKNFFSGTVVLKSKRCTSASGEKKEEPKAQLEQPQVEQKAEEQKQQPSA